jgi:Ribulose-5-phosphate 4-epimerase and related epimerases and aldolases
MNEREARQAVANAGRMLLQEKLVARTWGNVSCRTGTQAFVITPSGLCYEGMTADDVVLYEMAAGTWTGSRKPSSERGVHAAAYARFPEAGFVIHTHQTYASALGLAGFDSRMLTDGEKTALGGVTRAKYGLPGTKRLRANVTAALASGAHVVLMSQHGALIVGKDQKEAFERAKLLETVCKAACKGQPEGTDISSEKLASLTERVKGEFSCIAYTAAPAVRETAKLATLFRAQLDDMAQMIGPRLVTVDMEESAVKKALKTRDAVLVSGLGAICRAGTEGDCEALRLLVEKACVSFLHTRALHVSIALSTIDAWLMRLVYRKKYSKKIGG